MAEIIKRNKALSVSPLKASSTIGAALAFLGLRRSIPMLHGSQGCTAFGKVFFVRHFREPIPLQSTAMDQVTSVMGANENVVEGLRTVCEKSAPELIGVPTTGLAETQGADIHMAVREFRAKYPQFDAIPVVAVSTPDFVSFRQGCMIPRPRPGTVEALYLAIRRPHDVTVPPHSRGRFGGDGHRLCPLARYHARGCTHSRSTLVAGG